MPTVVVPFHGAEGKSRLAQLPHEVREVLGRAMLADVLDACRPLGPLYVVTPTPPPRPAATIVADPGCGQAAAVRAGLDAAVADGAPAPFVVVNADLACVTTSDVHALVEAIPDHGLALAAAADGTTNAIGLATPELFAPVYGAGSAARFAMLAPSCLVVRPNLVDDVDTVDDLERLGGRLGPNTRAALAELQLAVA